MEKTDFLNYRALLLETRNLKTRLTMMEDAIDFSSPQLSDMPKAPPRGSSALEARIIKVMEIRELYEEKYTALMAQLRAVEDAIGTLSSPAERLIMRLRYLEGRSWTSVCMALQSEGYSERQVYRLHGYALQKIKEI